MEPVTKKSVLEVSDSVTLKKPAQLQRLARILKFACVNFSYHTFVRVINKVADQTVRSAGWSAPLLFACNKVRFS